MADSQEQWTAARHCCRHAPEGVTDTVHPFPYIPRLGLSAPVTTAYASGTDAPLRPTAS